VTTYVDSSALLKRYIDEHDSDVAVRLLDADPVLVTSWVTIVEVRRNVARLVEPSVRSAVLRQVDDDMDGFALISVTETTARSAAAIAETLGVRSLDAIHLASAQRLQIAGLRFVTFDLRQAQAARSLGLSVQGA
jgi:uncharacterized protein